MCWSTHAAADYLSHAVRPPAEHLYNQIRRTHRGTRSMEARSRRRTTSDAKLQLDRNIVPGIVLSGLPSVSPSSVVHFPVEACLVPAAPLAPPAALSLSPPPAPSSPASVPPAAPLLPPASAPAAAPCAVAAGARVPGALPGDAMLDQACGQSQASAINVDSFLLHLNVRGFRENCSKIDALIRLHHRPHFVAFTETWLTKATKSIGLSGYHLVSRLDRRTSQYGGGIALFVVDGHEGSIVHIANSPTDERSWFIFHSDYGHILVCLWYRRPDYSEISSIQRFDQEFAQHLGQCVAAVCVGDFNVHNTEWLRFSSSTTPEGRELENVCCTNGLRQHVREPTRGDYLLDLVLSNFASGLTVKVVPGIHDNDHRAVIVRIKVHIPASNPVRRAVFDFRAANWEALHAELRQVDWQMFFSDLDADSAASNLSDYILDAARRWIPEKHIYDKLYAHPWLNNECVDALRRKHAASGTPDFVARRDECSTIFRNAYGAYIRKTRDELKSMSPSSRGLWKLADSLLAKRGGLRNNPAALAS